MRRHLLPLLIAAAVCGPAAPAPAAETAPFDLAGPSLRVSVTRAGSTLPIANVPQLATGDVIDVAADLPEDQSARYLLVAAFLRGSTNPPPDKWFYEAETWTKKGRKGLKLTVPEGAQQIALFLAPSTGGDFGTLRNAVQGRPGAFVRAAQALAQASLDRARLDAYLIAVRRNVPGDPERLERITPLLARSLQVKVNTDCLTKMADLQAPCLLQNQESLVLNDGHSNAITDAVAGPGVDLALQISATPQAGAGYYSPYIAAIRDIVGIFGSIRTAKYQYIPALGMPDGDRMRLVLNAPPSFHNPKSVLVSALPIVAPVHVPPLQLAEANPALCAAAPEPLLPVSGAPLVFATRYAHDLKLTARLPGGGTVDLPAVPDAEQGALRIQAAGKLPADLDAPVEATLHGIWGFDPFEGPSVRLQPARPGQWRLPKDAASGKNATVTLTGGVPACVAGVTARIGDGGPKPAEWKVTGADTISVSLPAAEAKAGAVTLEVANAAGTPPETLKLAAPAAPPRFAASVIARNVQRAPDAAPIAIKLDSDAQIPTDATLTVSLRADRNLRFKGDEAVEVAAEFGGTAKLTPSDGLTLADAQVALARLVPEKALGPSAFGPLRARIVRDGAAGEWLPLGTLVRLPALRQLECPAEPATGTCALTGDRLFLISALSPTPGFEQAVTVPEGFPGNMIQVPRPADGKLYLRLHDDPEVAARIVG